MTASGIQTWMLEPRPLCSSLIELLPEEDKMRAGRLVRRGGIHTFLACRLALRCLLANEMGVEPRAVELTRGLWGKPSVSGTRDRGPDDFSISHTDGLAVIALSRRGRIGIDVELQRPVRDRQAIAAQVFGGKVAEELAALPAADQEHAFFRLWTAAEALVKATGTGFAGLSGPLPLSLSGRGTAEFRTVEARSRGFGAWDIVPLILPGRFVGSLAVEGIPPGDCDAAPVAVQLEQLVAGFLH
jgi:phosphopantetheinyl transferase